MKTIILLMLIINISIFSQTEIVGGFTGNIHCGDETDFNTTVIANGLCRSSATQTNQPGWPNPGRIWVASGFYENNGADTLRIYYSDNGGALWNYAYYFAFPPEADFRPGELDIELCYDSASVWLFGVVGYNIQTEMPLTRVKSAFFRVNTSTNAVVSSELTWPGNTVTTNMYYYPRITSDNSVFASSGKIMIVCSFDSTLANTQHFTANKFCKINSPFAAAPVVDYAMPSGNIFFASVVDEESIYVWSDIAYTKSSSGNRLLVSYYRERGANVLLAWSDDYGASVTGNSFLSIGIAKNVSLAFNGGPGNETGLLIYRVQNTPANWDISLLKTSNAGINWAFSGFVENTNNSSRSVDVIAVRGANNLFKIAYTLDSASSAYGYYLGGIPGNFSQPSKLIITPSGVDTSFTKIIAGYKIGGGDDCFAVYSNSGGNNVISSRLCQSTVSISGNNSQTSNEFALLQNYPNPFNSATNIKFSIPKSSYVRLIVYDASGKEVETLVNSNLTAGKYSYDFNASGLASGVYFYRLQSDSFSDIRKMVLIK